MRNNDTHTEINIFINSDDVVQNIEYEEQPPKRSGFFGALATIGDRVEKALETSIDFMWGIFGICLLAIVITFILLVVF